MKRQLIALSIILGCTSSAVIAESARPPGSTKATPEATPETRPEAKMDDDWFGFAAYPDARRLCAEHISGNGMHIIWRSYATRSSPKEVVGFYEPGSKAEALRLEGADDTRLVVFSVADASKYPGCEQGPTKEEQSIIQVSKAIR